MEEFERRRRRGMLTGYGATQSAPCVKVVEWGLGTRGLGMLAAFWVGRGYAGGQRSPTLVDALPSGPKGRPKWQR